MHVSDILTIVMDEASTAVPGERRQCIKPARCWTQPVDIRAETCALRCSGSDIKGRDNKDTSITAAADVQTMDGRWFLSWPDVREVVRR